MPDRVKKGLPENYKLVKKLTNDIYRVKLIDSGIIGGILQNQAQNVENANSAKKFLSEKKEKKNNKKKDKK